MKMLELLDAHLADTRKKHARKEVQRIPNSVTIPQAPHQRGQRHDQAANEAAFDSRGNGLHFLRKLNAIAGHAWRKLLNRTA